MIAAADHGVILFLALAIDALIGDPVWLWRWTGHPVVWAGRLIEIFEKRLNHRNLSVRRKMLGGGFTVLVLMGAAICAGMALEWLLADRVSGFIASAVIASVFIAQRGLYVHVLAVKQAFAQGSLDDGRKAISEIAGRDPQQLDEAGVCRTAIESLAENFSDGVIAPAFWFLIAGLPGLFAYKALNTADSMIGYRSKRYETFGMAAAKLDDAANFIPARVSGLLISLAAFSSGAMRAMVADAKNHRSPNAGWPEAAMAGALGLALAGPRIYGGKVVQDSWMNAPGRKSAKVSDIGAALRLFVRAAVLHAALVLAVGVLLRL